MFSELLMFLPTFLEREDDEDFVAPILMSGVVPGACSILGVDTTGVGCFGAGIGSGSLGAFGMFTFVDPKHILVFHLLL
jgi:hypothetical protein